MENGKRCDYSCLLMISHQYVVIVDISMYQWGYRISNEIASLNSNFLFGSILHPTYGHTNSSDCPRLYDSKPCGLHSTLKHV